MKTFLAFMVILIVESIPVLAEDNPFYMETIHEKQMEYIISKSCEDIRENMDVLIETRNQTDAATSTIWVYSITRQIPVQPVAVIQLYTKINENPSTVCIPPFIETEDYVVKAWCEKSIDALKSFRMTDEDDELFRQSCLQRVVKTYSKLRKGEEQILNLDFSGKR